MIRKLKENDIDGVMRIWKNENIKAHNFIPKEYWKINHDYVREVLPKAEVYVYVIEENIIGFIGLEKDYIEGIFVDINNQCNGVGTSLLNKVKEHRDSLSLSVYKKNLNAVNFYKKNGFVITNETIDIATHEIEYIMTWKSSL